MQTFGALNRNINSFGLFDSGVGGLSVLKQLRKLANHADDRFVYVGDTARCPYGNRNQEEIGQFVEEIVRFLQMRNVDAIVMACNTSAALAYDVAKRVSTVPVFDLITPTARKVATLNKKVGVMATMATAKSHAFQKAINVFNPECEVFELGCPDLVPIVEGGNCELPATLEVLERHIAKLVEQQVETLILGCTHFPFLRKQIESLVQGQIEIVDPAVVLAETLAGTTDGANRPESFLRVSERADIFNISTRNTQSEFFVTGCANTFASLTERCIGSTVSKVENISVESLNELSSMSIIKPEHVYSNSYVTSHLVP